MNDFDDPQPTIDPPPQPASDEEARMRRALGLGGGHPARERDPEPIGSPQPRIGDRYPPMAQRRRFVQDGDVRVTVLRRDPQADPSGLAPKLARAEQQAAAEAQARAQAERTAAEAQALARDLRTKLGHVDLARTEAVEALRRAREAIAAERAEWHGKEARHQDVDERIRALQRELAVARGELAEERAARRVAEKNLKAAEEARAHAETLVRALSDDRPAPSPRVRAVAAPTRQMAAANVDDGQEPVKWWLAEAGAAKRK